MRALWETETLRSINNGALRPLGISQTGEALEYVLASHLVPENGLAVDLGCGLGASLALLSEYGMRAIGLDRKEEKTCQNAFRICADLRQPPLKDCIADLIMLECVLSLLPDPLAGLIASARIVKRGGILLVSDVTVRGREDSERGEIQENQKREGCEEREEREERKSERRERMSRQSCLQGAQRASLWRTWIGMAGFRILYERDYPRAIAELAAKMIWYGRKEENFDICASSRKCSYRKYSYGMWIAQKET